MCDVCLDLYGSADAAASAHRATLTTADRGKRHHAFLRRLRKYGSLSGGAASLQKRRTLLEVVKKVLASLSLSGIFFATFQGIKALVNMVTTLHQSLGSGGAVRAFVSMWQKELWNRPGAMKAAAQKVAESVNHARFAAIATIRDTAAPVWAYVAVGETTRDGVKHSASGATVGEYLTRAMGEKAFTYSPTTELPVNVTEAQITTAMSKLRATLTEKAIPALKAKLDAASGTFKDQMRDALDEARQLLGDKAAQRAFVREHHGLDIDATFPSTTVQAEMQKAAATIARQLMVLFVLPQLSADLMGKAAKSMFPMVQRLRKLDPSANPPPQIVFAARAFGGAVALTVGSLSMPMLTWLPTIIGVIVFLVLEVARHTARETRSAVRLITIFVRHAFAIVRR